MLGDTAAVSNTVIVVKTTQRHTAQSTAIKGCLQTASVSPVSLDNSWYRRISQLGQLCIHTRRDKPLKPMSNFMSMSRSAQSQIVANQWCQPINEVLLQDSRSPGVTPRVILDLIM